MTTRSSNAPMNERARDAIDVEQQRVDDLDGNALALADALADALARAFRDRLAR